VSCATATAAAVFGAVTVIKTSFTCIITNTMTLTAGAGARSCAGGA
jgi:hypothetical protein